MVQRLGDEFSLIPSFEQITRSDIFLALRDVLVIRLGEQQGGLPLLSKTLQPTVDLTGLLLPDTFDALADGRSNPSPSIQGVFPHAWNGASWDRIRANETVSVFSLGSRLATLQSSAIVNYTHTGMVLWVDVTAVAGTSPTLDFGIQFRNESSGSYVTITNFNQITATGGQFHIYALGVNENLSGANQRHALLLPRRWRLAAVIGGTNPDFTFQSDVSHEG